MAEPAPYRIELAKSDRSTCTASKAKIEKGEIRFGALVNMGGKGSYKWRKLECLTQKQVANVKDKLGGPENIDGFSELTVAQQAAVLQSFEAVATGITATLQSSKSDCSLASAEEHAPPPAKKARKSAAAGKQAAAATTGASPASSSSGSGLPAPVPSSLTPEILEAAHKLIDSAKSGRWGDLFSQLDGQPELVNVRPEVREYSALHQACYFGKVEVVRTLLTKYGASPAMFTKHGQSASEVAEEQGHVEVVALLATHTSKSDASKSLCEPAGSVDLTPEKVGKADCTANFASRPAGGFNAASSSPVPALASDAVQLAHKLIDHAKAGQWEALFAMLDKRKELVNIRPDVREYSALHQAAYHDNKDALLTLIEKYGADQSLLTASGHSLKAVAEMQGSSSVIKALSQLSPASSIKSASMDDSQDADDDQDFEMKQMPDGSWKVMQKVPSKELEASASQPSDAAAKVHTTILEACSSTTAKSSWPVDKEFPSADKCCLHHTAGTTWHCLLTRATQFHLIQVVQVNSDEYCVWNRWGKADTKGQHEATHFATAALAEEAFASKFFEKSNNKWESRKSFKQYFGKFAYKPEPGVDDLLSAGVPTMPAMVPTLTDDAAQRAHELIDMAKLARWSELFKALEADRSLVNARPEVREFAVLHQAAFQGDTEVVTRLIDEFGANPAQPTKFGALPAAVAEEQGYEELAEQLRLRLQKSITAAGG